VKLNGQDLGTVPILDRNGVHVEDKITIDNRHDTTKLNGTYDPTDVQ
jgi:hypothetical protein